MTVTTGPQYLTALNEIMVSNGVLLGSMLGTTQEETQIFPWRLKDAPLRTEKEPTMARLRAKCLTITMSMVRPLGVTAHGAGFEQRHSV
jgi:hypothetical protein